MHIARPALRPPRTCLALTILFLLPWAAAGEGGIEAVDGDCLPERGISYVCGVTNAEDMVVLPGTGHVLAGELVGRRGDGRVGGFHLIDTRSGRPVLLAPDFSGPARAPYDDCTDVPPPGRFGAHGLSIRAAGPGRFDVLAVNHGGRESIEAFRLDLTATPATMTWRGCVVVPREVSANAVAHLQGAGMAVTSFGDRSDPESLRRLSEGGQAGFALRWDPGQGWRRIPGTDLAGVNGTLASADGRWLYLTAWGEGALYGVDLQDGAVRRLARLPGLRADNIRLDGGGALLIAGQVAAPQDVIECSASHEPRCLLPWRVVRVDPATGDVMVLADQPAGSTFGAASVAVEVGNSLWIGTFKGDRIAVAPQPPR